MTEKTDNRRNALRVFGTLCAAACFGWLADQGGVPLPWIIGPMVGIGIAAALSVPSNVPSSIRDVGIAVIGIYLGSAFTPDVVATTHEWIPSIVAVVPNTVCMVVAGYCVLRLFGIMPVPGIIAVAPGNLSQMVALSEEYRTDVRVVSTVHSTRMALIVLLAPAVFLLLFAAQDTSAASQSNDVVLAMEHLFLAALILAWPLASLLRIPSPQLLGPMTLSAVGHGTGFIDAGFPSWASISAQVVLGAAIGARFAGIKLREMSSLLWASVVLTLVLCLVSVVFAIFVHVLTGLDLALLTLAYLPGGTPEMALTASALGADPAFVSAHHLVRMGLVVSLAPFLVRYVQFIDMR